jgi:hypothetical protein
MSSAASTAADAQTQASERATNAQTQASVLAAEAQVEATKLGVDEQRRQFEAFQKVLAPFVGTGQGALGNFAPYQQAGARAFQDQQNLIGLGGPVAQRSAIGALEQSPQFASLVQQGENAMLQNASATGGLRGGNLQGAMAQFRPQLLQQLIDRQYTQLGGLAGVGLGVNQNLLQVGQASAAGTGAAGLQTGQGIANLLSNQGQAQANMYGQQGQFTAQNAANLGGISAANAMAQGQAFSGLANAIPQAVMGYKFYNGGA